jgi:hypothetical protein
LQEFLSVPINVKKNRIVTLSLSQAGMINAPRLLTCLASASHSLCVKINENDELFSVLITRGRSGYPPDHGGWHGNSI